MAKLTIKMLKDAGACAPKLRRLKRLFGSSVEITEEFCVEHASEGGWDWASKLLSPEAQAEYERVTAAALAEYERVTDAALAEYERVGAPAQAEYNRVTAPALVEYDRVTAPALAEYDRVTAPALAEYNRVLNAARVEYDRVVAAAWARLWIQDHQEIDNA